MKRLALTLAVVLSSGLTAQDFLYLTGFSDSGGPLGPNGNSYPIGRFKDLDKDGTITDGTELFAFLKKSFNTRNATGSFIADITWIQERDTYAFYIADSADGRITRGVDANDNGLLEDTEVTEYYDLMTGFAPEGITARRDPTTGRTIVYVAVDDQTASPGIHRFDDINGNGVATDPGEHTIFVDKTKGLSVTGKAGPVALVDDWWFSLKTLPNGRILAYNAGPSRVSGGGGGAQGPSMFCWYELVDNNGVASVSVFFNPSQINGIATHPDFAVGGSFPRWDVVTSGTNLHPTWCDIPWITRARNLQPGPRVYYIGSSYRDQAAGITGRNPSGQLVSGLFYRWVDLNSNNAIDPNEITLFANMSNATVAGVAPITFAWSGTPAKATLDNNLFGLVASDGKLHLCWDSRTGGKGILTMTDSNQNGVIDTGEAVQSYFWSGSQSPTAPVYSPTFGPFIKAFGSFDQAFMPGPFPTGLTPYGKGCPLSGSGLSVVCDAAGGAPRVGNASFEVAMIRGVPSLPGHFLFVGLTRTNVPLSFLGLPASCALLVNSFAGFGPFLTNAAGAASVAIPIPNNPSLVNGRLDFQWVTSDPGASPPLRVSNGLEVTIQP
jgi:hypothetical protein